MAAEIVLEMDPLLNSIKEKLQIIGSQPTEQEEPCTIYRVVPSVRTEDGVAYDPKIISIGPYHRKKNHLLPMEDVKWCYLQSLLRRVPENNTLENLLGVVRAQAPRARRMYSEKLWLEPDAFVKMLLLDGCFIVEFLIKFILGDNYGQLLHTNWKMPLVRSDLLLLENQIPFFILQCLFDSVGPIFVSNNKNLPPITLTELALSYVTQGTQVIWPETMRKVEIHHLLHLFQISLTPNPGLSGSQPFSCMKVLKQTFWKCIRFFIDVIFWLLSSFLCCFTIFRRQSHHLPSKRDGGPRAPRMIPSATELQEAGIIFKEREMKQENEKMCFLDVKFEDGIIEIPRVSIQGVTISMFRNVIAFEQSCPDSGSHFTSYAAFMDNLINTPMDVAILQDCGIIESKLGSDKEVAIFFNQLCKGGYLDYESHYLAQVFKDVRKFSLSRRHRWRAMLVHDYFNNPWAIISFVAAFLLLGLTIVQTIYTILSYVHPHN